MCSIQQGIEGWQTQEGARQQLLVHLTTPDASSSALLSGVWPRSIHPLAARRGLPISVGWCSLALTRELRTW